jgi:glycosyltransferase involved in cell wall biosynthesis
MKILLVGEYSRLHNSLKEGLTALGHTVHIVSAGDDFKNYPSDFSIRPELNNRYPLLFFRKLIHKFTGYDIAVRERTYRLKKIIEHLKDYDIVQLINTYPFETGVKNEEKFLRQIFKNNRKTFLLACGDDYVSNTYYLEGKMKYSVLTPLLENPTLRNRFEYSLKYLGPPFKNLHDFVIRHVRAVIPSDLDYAIPYRNHPKNAGMIPNPVNTDKIGYRFPPLDKKIVILHGINSGNVLKKGNIYFGNALKLIKKKFKERVEIIETVDVPYAEYIKLLEQAHIVLDQVYSYDQGYHALESMAMGKVVFTGAEQEFTEHYGLKRPVCINALPDSGYIFEKLSELIENPGLLAEISRNARQFIEKEHHYVKIAERYLATWQRF